MTASAFKNSWVGFSRRPDDFAALGFTETFAQTKRRGGFSVATRAPVCSARICPESSSAVSCGGTVFTTDPLMRKMSATFMAGSVVREVSKPLVYQELCSLDAARHFNFVARGTAGG